MLQKMRLLSLIGLLALLATPSWGADSRSFPGPSLQRGELSQLWIGNLGNETADIRVEKTRDGAVESEKVTLGPGEITRLARSPNEEVRVLNDKALLLIGAPASFERNAVQLESPGLPDQFVARGDPKGPRSTFKRGQQASAALVWSGSGSLTVDLVLLEPTTSVDIQLLSPDGRRLGYANVTTGRPVSLKVDLGQVLTASGYRGLLRADLHVFRGQARGSVTIPRNGSTAFVLSPNIKLGGGSANYSVNRQWAGYSPGTVYYYISNGPHNTCGELNTFRNGSWLISPGWACTDGNGNVTKGPWDMSTYTTDQTDDPSYIRWPDGSSTNTDWHVVDGVCPTTTRTSPDGSPPTTYYGNASDGIWGNCFGSWSYVYSIFYDYTTNLYWTPSAGAYSAGPLGAAIYGVLSGRPSCGVSWDTAFPPPEAHASGHAYLWETCVSDGGCAYCTNLNFTH